MAQIFIPKIYHQPQNWKYNWNSKILKKHQNEFRHFFNTLELPITFPVSSSIIHSGEEHSHPSKFTDPNTQAFPKSWIQIRKSEVQIKVIHPNNPTHPVASEKNKAYNPLHYSDTNWWNDTHCKQITPKTVLVQRIRPYSLNLIYFLK